MNAAQTVLAGPAVNHESDRAATLATPSSTYANTRRSSAAFDPSLASNTAPSPTSDVFSLPSSSQTILSPAPSSPSSRSPHTPSTKLALASSFIPQNPASITDQDTLARISYGPATQTTVVTTTTTTTTEFPPIILKAPRHLNELDPRKYPLANAETPAAIAKIRFDHDGRLAVLQEVDHPVQFAQQIACRQDALAAAGGRIDQVTNNNNLMDRAESISRSTLTPSKNNPCDPPLSKQESEDLAYKLICHGSQSYVREPDEDSDQTRPRKRRTLNTSSTPLLSALQDSAPFPPLPFALSHPANPCPDESSGQLSVDAGCAGEHCQDHVYQCGILAEAQSSKARLKCSETESPASSSPRNQTQQRHLAPLTDDALAGKEVLSRDWNACPRPSLAKSIPADEERNASHFAVAADPQIEVCRATSLAQDARLPSPSLSPVSRATRLVAQQSSDRALSPISNADLLTQDNEDHSKGYPMKARDPDLSDKLTQCAQLPPPSKVLPSDDNNIVCRPLSVIPDFVGLYDGAHDDFQSYLLLQLLKRSSKSVLRMVAQTVNPALKWDFIRFLPTELSEIVLDYLDLKSLCAASQVSRRWRQQIDAAENLWKRVFFQQGFRLQEEELSQAARGELSWQIRERKRCLGKVSTTGSQAVSSTHPPLSAQSTSQASNALSLSLGLRRARKEQDPLLVPKLARKKRIHQYDENVAKDSDLHAIVDTTLSNPNSNPDLFPDRPLHLWKPLFLRHAAIRQSWLHTNARPHHLAFQAHERHVVTCLQFDDDKIITGSDDASIRIFSTQTGVLRRHLLQHEGGVWALQYSGNILVSGSTDRTVRVWDLGRGICTHVLHGHTSTVRCLKILFPEATGTHHPNGQALMLPKYPLIITGSRDSQLRVWKLPQLSELPFGNRGPFVYHNASECPYFLQLLAGHHHSVRAIAAHHDTVISGSYDCTVRVWRISTGETIHRLLGHTQKVYSVVLDSKRNRCISGSMDNVVKVWSLETGAALFNLEGHSSLVGLLDLHDDLLVSAAADSTLRVWNPENGHCSGILKAHTGAITCFQHDGSKVISGSDRNLKLWNISTGTLIRDLLTNLTGVWQVQFNERRCVAAVQRNNHTYIEVMDFGARCDGVAEDQLGRRILVDRHGVEMEEPEFDNLPGQLEGALRRVGAAITTTIL